LATKIIAPKLGMSTEPLTVVEWKAKEGGQVKKGSIVLVVETEKIRHDVETEASGFLHILVKEGNEAPIGSVAGLIAETEEELAALQKEAPKEAPAAAETKKAPQAKAEAPVAARAEGERIRISPLARKMAEEHLIDISRVMGSGPEGRIVKEDIEREIEARKKIPAAPAEVAPEALPGVHQGKRIKSTTPLTGTRKTIAEHMHRSLSVTAQLTLVGINTWM